MTKAIHGKVSNIKAFQSTGICRIEIEIPYESYKGAVAEIFDRAVLVTIAPGGIGAYGIIEPREGPAPPVVEKVAKDPLGSLAKWAVMRCQDRAFQDWVRSEFSDKWQLWIKSGDDHEWLCKHVICDVCGIGSRRELDTDQNAAKIFDQKFRLPYSNR